MHGRPLAGLRGAGAGAPPPVAPGCSLLARPARGAGQRRPGRFPIYDSCALRRPSRLPTPRVVCGCPPGLGTRPAPAVCLVVGMGGWGGPGGGAASKGARTTPSAGRCVECRAEIEPALCVRFTHTHTHARLHTRTHCVFRTHPHAPSKPPAFFSPKLKLKNVSIGQATIRALPRRGGVHTPRAESPHLFPCGTWSGTRVCARARPAPCARAASPQPALVWGGASPSAIPPTPPPPSPGGAGAVL